MTDTTPLALAEAEVLGVVEVTKEAIWARNVMKDLGLEQFEATPICNDNKPALHLASRMDGTNKRMRHVMDKVAFSNRLLPFADNENPST